jgi:hypothetical protein
MSARWLAIVIAGCSFSPPTGTSPSDGPRHDAPRDVPVDMPPDVPVSNEGIQFVQGRAMTFMDSAIVDLGYNNTETAGDFNIVIVSWANNASINDVRDDLGNPYTQATSRVSAASSGQNVVLQVFYRANVAALKIGVMVDFNGIAKNPELRIAEYSGIVATSPLDGTPRTAEATGSDLDTGTLNTSHPNELLVAAEVSADTVDQTDATFTSRSQLAVAGDIVEDRIVTTTGTYHATAQLQNSSPWVMALIPFIGAVQP